MLSSSCRLVPWLLAPLPGPSLVKWKAYAVVSNAAAAVAVFALCVTFGLSTRAQTAPDVPPVSDDSKPQGETIVLSLFEVRASTDRGYVAGNAVSATRISTVINDLPFSINAITAS